MIRLHGRIHTATISLTLIPCICAVRNLRNWRASAPGGLHRAAEHHRGEPLRQRSKLHDRRGVPHRSALRSKGFSNCPFSIFEGSFRLDFGRLVLGFIETDVCNRIFFLQQFPKSTKLVHFLHRSNVFFIISSFLHSLIPSIFHSFSPSVLQSF